MSSQRSLREILDLMLSRRYLVAGITLGAFLAAGAFSFTLPRKYESFTQVRVVDNAHLYEIYGRRLAGAKSGTERIRAIHQEMLSRNSVVELIEQLNLDRELAGLPERERLEKTEAIITGIQANTTVDLKETTRGQFIFKITHTSTDPAMAQRVVTHLSTGYQSRQYAEQKSQATGTLKTVQQQVVMTTRDYRLAADDLTSFEESHTQHRFGQESDTRTRLQIARDKLSALEVDIQTLDLQFANIEKQLAEEDPWIEVPKKIGNEGTIDRIKEEIRRGEQLFLELTEGRGYTDEHPDVIAQKVMVAHLKRTLEEEETKFRTVTEKVPNPIFAELRKSRILVMSALTVKRKLRADAERRTNELKALMLAYPELKKQWEALVDRKRELKERLSDLRQDEERAKITWDNRVAENTLIFDVLDPPVYPLSPVSPNRAQIAIVGLLIGLGAGVGVVFVLDFFDHSFRYTEEVSAAIELPILGSIARIETMAEREVARRKKRVAAAAVLALLLAAGAATVLQITHEGLISSFLRDTVNLVK